jgi:hypothetical protein
MKKQVLIVVRDYIILVTTSVFLVLSIIYLINPSKETIKYINVIKTDTIYIEKNIVINDKRDYGFEIKDYNLLKLKQEMRQKGFRNLDNLNLFKLRRVWLAYHYDDVLMYVHNQTDFPVSMVYSFFIIEATTTGIETDLWRLHANPGGVKALGKNKLVSYRTREVIKGKDIYINAKFFSTNDTKEGIELWSQVLNNKRYNKCKKYDLPPKMLYKKMCRCIYENGYHTDKNIALRASLMQEYWEIKKHFPVT